MGEEGKRFAVLSLASLLLSGAAGACSKGQKASDDSSTGETGGNSSGDGDGDGDVNSGSGGRVPSGGGSGNAGAPNVGDERPDFLSVVPDYFAFGYSYFWDSHAWPPEVYQHGVEWNYMYWYHLIAADETVLPARLQAAAETGAMPVLTHYQLLDRGNEAGITGDDEIEIVLQAVEDPDLMRAYYQNIQDLMEEIADYPGYLIFQTEPDSTTWLHQFHTNETHDANNGHVAVAETGHPDLADLPNTIAGYVQGIVRLRDLYAPHNVYIGLCIFDNENGYNPQDSVKFIQSLGTEPDVLFTHHVVKFSNKNDGWWDDYSETDQQRFLTWIRTITEATGLRYLHWQSPLGEGDYGLMPDYPTEERISDLVAAGSIGNLLDIYKLDGPPHSQPWHGFSTSPPTDHPAYNSLDKLEERLLEYYADPITIPE